MQLQRSIGLVGATAIVVGSVIGMGAFVLLPIVCAQAGSSAWLAILLAVVVSLIGVLPVVQLASAMPVAGGGFAFGTRLLSPLIGIVMSWWGVLGGAAAPALVSYGLAESFRDMLPAGWSLHLTALGIVAVFYAVQRMGVRLLAGLQVAMVVQMLVALLLFGIVGVMADGHGIRPTLPSDSGFIIALLVSFNICMGFQVIVELGEEMHSPGRNMFRALGLSALLVLVFYMLVAAAYMNLTGPIVADSRPELVGSIAPHLPEWAVAFIRIGVVGAALTSFNGTAIAIPRELYAQARGGVLPAKMAEIGKGGTPHNAVSLYFVVVFVLLLLGEVLNRAGVLQHFFGQDVIEFYGFITVSGILLLTLGLGMAAWRLPSRFPQEYSEATVRLPMHWLRLAIVVSVVANGILIALMFSKWIIPVVVGGVTLTVVAFGRVRLKV